MPRPTGLEEVVVRRLAPAELGLAVEWAAREGWNPGLADAATFAAAGSSGYFVAEASSEPVGVISAVPWGPDFGFIGFYIVRPDRRGQGIGHRLWDRAERHLARRAVGLDGVPEQEATYATHGFRRAHVNRRMAGPVGAWRGRPARSDLEIRPSQPGDLAALEQFDRRSAPAGRHQYLKAWLAQPLARSVVALTGGGVSGWAVARPCRRGWKLGPVLALGPDTARALVVAALDGLDPDAIVHLDAPDANPEAGDLARRHEMTEVFSTVRMYRGLSPAPASADSFGVTTFELG